MQKQQALTNKRGAYQGQMMEMVALGATIAAPLTAAVRFESVMADVKKVVDFDSPTQFKQMGQDVLKLSTVMPMAASGIGDIVAQAGQAGIARTELLRFAEDATKMGVAFDMAGKESGSAMTGMRSIFHLNQNQVVSLGDAYNHLSNNMDATAADMLRVSNRAGSTAKLFGLTGQQVGALGATFLALKTPPEVAGTGINALLQKLKTAEKQGGKFKKALDDIGFSARDMKGAIEDDAQGTLLSVLESVKGSDDVMGTLSDLFGLEYADDIAKLVGSLDLYKKSLSLVSNETQYAGSMQREYEERAKTTSNNLQLLKNQTVRLGVTVGNVLLPPLNAVVGVLGRTIDTVAIVAQTYPTATKVVVGLAMGLAALKVSAIAGGYAWTFMQGGWLSGVKALRKVQVGLTLATVKLNAFNLSTAVANKQTTSLGMGAGLAAYTGKIKKLGTTLTLFSGTVVPAMVVGIKSIGLALATNPIGWAVLGIAAGATLIHKYWQPVSVFMGGVWDGFVAGIEPVTNSLKPVGQAIGYVADKVGDLFSWMGQLFTPVTLANEQLEGFASTGEKVGQVFASLFNVVTLPFRTAIELIDKAIAGVSWLGSAIGFGGDDENAPTNKPAQTSSSPLGKVMKPLAMASVIGAAPVMASTAPANYVTAPNNATDSASPVIAKAQAQPVSIPMLTPPTKAQPKVLSRLKERPSQQRLKSSKVEHKEEHTWHVQVVQQPGEDQNQMVDKLMREIDKRKATKKRGTLFDE